MQKLLMGLVLSLGLGGVAQAQDKAAAPAGGPDMMKMGPWSRPVGKPDTKGVDELYKAMDEAWKKGDMNAVADNTDFPVIMMSDDSKGTEKHFEATREQFLAMMAPMAGGMPKDVKMTAKHKTTFFSDTLALWDADVSMSMGKMKHKFHSACIVTKVGDKWKVKQMLEAGWGDMPPPAAPKAAMPAKGAAPMKK